MELPIKELMSQGTLAGVFMAVLLIALVMFTAWAKKLIAEQLKQKDDRILRLETDVKDLQHFTQGELMNLVAETHKLLQRGIDSQERIERALITNFKNTV